MTEQQRVDTAQYPFVRTLRWCPTCGHSKRTGLILCWPCHNGFKELFDGDYGPVVTLRLDRLEEAKIDPRAKKE